MKHYLSYRDKHRPRWRPPPFTGLFNRDNLIKYVLHHFITRPLLEQKHVEVCRWQLERMGLISKCTASKSIQVINT